MPAAYLLCRNRVRDFGRWKRAFDGHREAHRAAGLDLRFLGRDADDRSSVFFLFRVADRARAEPFLSAPGSEQAGKAAGVLDGDYRFLEAHDGGEIS